MAMRIRLTLGEPAQIVTGFWGSGRKRPPAGGTAGYEQRATRDITPTRLTGSAGIGTF